MLELWGAEYQESNALLLQPSDRSFLERVCQREKCPVDFVGNITGDGKARFRLARVDKCTSIIPVISPCVSLSKSTLSELLISHSDCSGP